MNELFQQILSMPVPFNMVVMICLIFSVTTVFTSIAKQLRKYGCHRQDVEFKRELVDRGLAAEEIERIVHAKGPSTSSDADD